MRISQVVSIDLCCCCFDVVLYCYKVAIFMPLCLSCHVSLFVCNVASFYIYYTFGSLALLRDVVFLYSSQHPIRLWKKRFAGSLVVSFILLCFVLHETFASFFFFFFFLRSGSHSGSRPLFVFLVCGERRFIVAKDVTHF